MKTINITIHGEPFGKLNLRPVMRGGHASSYSPKENNWYMDRVIGILNEIDFIRESEDVIFPKEVSVAVHIVAYFKIPEGNYKYYKKEKRSRWNQEGQDMIDGKIRPNKKPDLDNISKAICDGISHHGKVWHDDSQVVEEHIEKYYSEFPRVEVTIKEVKHE